MDRLFGEECGDQAGPLSDLGECVDMAIRPYQRRALDWRAGGRDPLYRLLHDRLVENQIVGRIEDERGHLDGRRVDRSKLIGSAQIKKMIGIGYGGARRRRLLENRFDFELVASAFAGSLPASAGAVPNVLRAHSQLLACRVTSSSAALRPSSGGSLS